MSEKLVKAENFIAGEFKAAASGKYLDSYEPSTGKVWAQIPDSDSADVDKAVKAAQEAFPSWKRLSVNDRAQHLFAAAEVVMASGTRKARSQVPLRCAQWARKF